MYLGRIVEIGDKETIYRRPMHPYTEALLAAVPVPRPGRPRRRAAVQGEIPSPMNPPAGCAFHPRCPLATDRCRAEVPVLRQVGGRDVACHLADTRI
jgi:oligopeptide transport system ATP-binding protein